MNRTLKFVLIGAVIGCIACVVVGLFDKSGGSSRTEMEVLIGHVFVGVCGAFLGGALGFGIAKVETNPTGEKPGKSQAKSAPAKPKRDPVTQAVIETLGALAFIALPVFRLMNLQLGASSEGIGALVGGIVGVLLVLVVRVVWIFNRKTG